MNMKKIAEALRALADALEDDTTSVAPEDHPDNPVKRVTKPRKSEPSTEESEPVAEKTEPTTAPAAEVTKVDVISALQAVAKVKDRAAIDKILADFNVAKVGQLDEADYADVVEVAKAALE